MITTYKAAPDIDVLTSSFPIPGFGLVPINAFVLHGPEPVLVDTGAVVEREELRTASAIGHRSGRPEMDLAHRHRLRPHRGTATVARRERRRTDHHHVSRGRDHEPHRPAAAGPGASLQPWRADRRGRPDTDRRQATGVQQFCRRRAFTMTSRGRCSARTASVHSCQQCPRTLLSSGDDELRQGQIFWATVDSPWLHKVDTAAFARELDGTGTDPADDDPEQPSTRHLRQHDGSDCWRLSRPSRQRSPSSHQIRRHWNKC